ncbi:hypothetical protein GC163_19130 [bacterium]|nr:hypothetical protein [bacterium]
MEPIPPPVEPPCPLCGMPLISVWTHCPNCGELVSDRGVSSPVPNYEKRFAPAKAKDYIGFGLFAIISLAYTLPYSFSTANNLWNGYVLPSQLISLSLWLGWIWGIPTAAALYEWRLGALAGVDRHTYMIRRFWHIQAVTAGIPLGLMLAVVTVLLIACTQS